MASGDLLAVFTPLSGQFRLTSPATFDVRNEHPVLDFDADADAEVCFAGVMPPHYGGGGVTATVVWLASTATSNKTVWQGQFERHEDDNFDLDADGFAAVQEVIATAASVSGEAAYDDITFTDGGQMDSVAANESYRFLLRRNADDATNDDMTGDAEMLRLVLKET